MSQLLLVVVLTLNLCVFRAPAVSCSFQFYCDEKKRDKNIQLYMSHKRFYFSSSSFSLLRSTDHLCHFTASNCSVNCLPL